MDRRELLNDPEESLRLALDGRLAQVWTCLPGVVVSVDLSKMVCSVQPTIQARLQAPDGSYSYVNLPQLINCPIVFPKAGGFVLTLPIKPGDEVLINFSSRCIDGWWQTGTSTPPAELRMHDLSDGFVTPGICSQAKLISGVSGDAAQLRNESGDVFLEIQNSGIKIKAPIIEIEGNINATGDLNLIGEATIAGNLTALAVAAGTVAASSGLTIGGSSYTNHRHGGVQTGSGQTGGVVP